jgi:hypothetical protein
MRRLVLAALIATLMAASTSVVLGHTTAPTGLVVTGSTDTSVALDWKQDYADDYDGYYVRADGGPRVRYPGSEGTVTGLRPGTGYRFCVTIDLAEPGHPDESSAACITGTTKGAPAPAPTPEAGPAPSPAPAAAPAAGSPRFAWTKSSSTQAEFDKVKSLGFSHAMVNPDPAQLARVAAAGLRAVIWGGNYDDACFWRWSDATFTQKVNAMKTSPHLGLVDVMFIADEPHSAASGSCANSPADMRARHALSKSLLPNVQTMISENRTEDFANLARTTDLFAAIKYPCSNAKGCVPAKIDETMSAVNAAGITNWWAVVQSFREPPGGYYRAPNATELRQLMDRWEAGGPDGMAAYAWGDGCCGDDIGLRDLPELWPVWQAENAG